ncbi:MAG: acyl-ACP thioesterase [Alistipes sp.]|nr:acyl-ACP thioesterase [Alistipes sp.]
MAEKSVFQYSVEPESVDFTSRASISSMFNMVLHAAGRDAHRRGFGIDVLAEKNYGWVLSRMCLELDYIPAEYEEFTLYTWIGGYNRLASTRNFILADKDGREFGRAVSQWCMLDFDTRMPVDMNTLAKVHEGTIVDAPSPCDAPKRIAAVAGDKIAEHRVAYSHIDFNRHMNTMRYIDFAFDTLPIEVPEKLSAMRMDLNFMKEALYGDTLSLARADVDGAYCFEFRNSADEPLCRMALEIR